MSPLQAVGQIALTYLPAMNRVFHTAPLGWDAWLRILAIGLAASLVVAAEKRLRREPLPRRSPSGLRASSAADAIQGLPARRENEEGQG